MVSRCCIGCQNTASTAFAIHEDVLKKKKEKLVFKFMLIEAVLSGPLVVGGLACTWCAYMYKHSVIISMQMN